jgi:putative oxygen-independent coproporphyrinogen III oxidase
MPLGLYISVPFCRTKCTYCNFASDVFSRTVFNRYLDRVCSDLEHACALTAGAGGLFETAVDSVYLGGGTPTVLDSQQLRRLFVTIKQNFCLQAEAEITVECAPGTLSDQVVGTLVASGVTRVSLGVQSFVDQEAASVGRLHNRKKVLDEIASLRAAGITNINIDLIAGLPNQTLASWEYSVKQTIAIGVPHVSIYMLEVDEDSRLGRELIAGGAKYHAHFVPDEDLTADLYLMACDHLNAAAVEQYEISNFARTGFESRHNLKYWTRQPYLGFGLDAHSMLKGSADAESVRLATADALESYVSGAEWKPTLVSRHQALEEAFFLGLRLNRGVDLNELEKEFGSQAVADFASIMDELVNDGFLERRGSRIGLTSRGRLLSNEVFEKFIAAKAW